MTFSQKVLARIFRFMLLTSQSGKTHKNFLRMHPLLIYDVVIVVN